MIDTIVLTFKQDMFNIMHHDYFSPSTEGLYKPEDYYRLGRRSNMVCKQNPTPSELKAGIYKPRITVTKRLNRQRQFEITMKIEFSIPKLLFGNNFDELEETDFEKVIQKLKYTLRSMGVFVFEYRLINATVSTIHFGKNIALIDYTTPYTYIKILSKANINQRLDLNQTDFRNEGQSLKYRANSFEIAFYDKIKDIQKARVSEKRAEEKDNHIQLNLFKEVKVKEPFEVLRIEIRLNKKQKLIQILKLIGIDEPPTFKMLFSKSTAQKILMHYINEIEASYPKILSYTATNPKDFLTELILHNPRVPPKKALQMLGLRVFLTENGIRDFREMFRRQDKTNWYKLQAELKQYIYPKQESPLKILRDAIEEFKPLKLVDFKINSINNNFR